MKENVKATKTKRNVILSLIIPGIIAFCFLLYIPIMKYMDTHTWATIRITGSVQAETSDAYEDTREFLKGESHYLHNTSVIIEDITHDGEVTIIFEPEVKNSETGELMKVAVIDKNNIINIEEVCNNGDSASWQFWVISNRYQ